MGDKLPARGICEVHLETLTPEARQGLRVGNFNFQLAVAQVLVDLWYQLCGLNNFGAGSRAPFILL